MKPLHALNRTKKLLVGVATIWPLIYIPLFFVFVFSIVFSSVAQNSDVFPKEVLIIFPVHFLTIISMFVLMGLYIFDLFKNTRIENGKKALWAVVIFLGGIVAMPVYWYLYVWKTSKTLTKKK